MARSLTILAEFERYLNGETDLTALKQKMNADYAHHAARLDHDFHKIGISAPEVSPYVREILKALGIRDARFVDADITFYDFLLELSYCLEHGSISASPYVCQKNPNVVLNQDDVVKQKIDTLIALIEEQDRTLLRLLQMTSAISMVLLTSTASILLTVKSSLSFIRSIMASTLFMSGVGMIFTLGVAVYTGFQENQKSQASFMQRFSDNFLLLSSTALNTAAYSVLIAASVTMNPVAAILFVVAAGTDFLKEFINFMRLSFQGGFSSKSSMDHTNATDKPYEAIRLENDRIKSRNGFFVKALAASAITGSIAVWVFFPPSIFVTIGAVLGIGLTYVIRSLCLSYNERKMKEKLENDFLTLENRESTETHSDDKPARAPALEVVHSDRPPGVRSRLKLFDPPTVAPTVASTVPETEHALPQACLSQKSFG